MRAQQVSAFGLVHLVTGGGGEDKPAPPPPPPIPEPPPTQPSPIRPRRSGARAAVLMLAALASMDMHR